MSGTSTTLRDKILTLRIAGTLAEQLKATARLTGQTPSELAREILVCTMAEVVAGTDINETTNA